MLHRAVRFRAAVHVCEPAHQSNYSSIHLLHAPGKPSSDERALPRPALPLPPGATAGLGLRWIGEAAPEPVVGEVMDAPAAVTAAAASAEAATSSWNVTTRRGGALLEPAMMQQQHEGGICDLQRGKHPGGRQLDGKQPGGKHPGDPIC